MAVTRSGYSTTSRSPATRHSRKRKRSSTELQPAIRAPPALNTQPPSPTVLSTRAANGKHKTGFFDLPRELRDEIYRLALDDALELNLCRGCEHCSRNQIPRRLRALLLLRSLCRQTRSEASKLYFFSSATRLTVQPIWVKGRPPLYCRTFEDDVRSFPVQAAQTLNMVLWSMGECKSGEVTFAAQLHLRVVKQQEAWSAKLVSPDYSKFEESKRAIRVAKDEAIREHLTVALQEPLLRLNGGSMTFEFVKDLADIFKEADAYD